MKKSSSILALAAALLAVAGCFDEPVPASRTVPAENRIWLTEKGLADLSAQTLAPAADYLNLDRNQLTNVAPVAALKALKWLRLNDNRLEQLPDLKGLSNLRRIYLKNNRFKAVPETLKDLPQLTDIELSGNPIGAIFAQQVRFSSGKNVLGEPVDVRAYVADLRESERRRDLRLKELAARCGPCPVCGADRPDLYADVGWDYFEMRCLRFGCAKNVMIKARSENELLRLWKSLPKSDGGGFHGLTSEGRQV